MAEILDGGGQVDVVALDMAKAFDRFNHKLLMDMVGRLGLDRWVVRWIGDFLRNRVQRVRVGEELSEVVKVNCGVPQGSILGPLLFIIYVNDLKGVGNIKLRLFADDILIYKQIRNEKDCEGLQEWLNEVNGLIEEKKMKVNVKKSQMIRITQKKTRIIFSYAILEEVIKEEEELKYLGVIVDSKMKWKSHIGGLVRRAYKVVYMLRRILKGCKREVKEKGYLMLVRPLLEYSSGVWDPYQGYLREELEMVQRRAARFVMDDYRKRSSVGRMLRILGWESLKKRRVNRRVMGMFKAYVGWPAWNDIKMRLEEEEVFRGRRDHGYKVRLKGNNKQIGRYSFIGRGVREWNGLGKEILSPFPTSLNVLKRRLKGAGGES